jgi:hypothetical protein
MKYLLLIQHGDMPKPGAPEWEALSADEQKFVAVKEALNGVGCANSAVQENPLVLKRDPLLNPV